MFIISLTSKGERLISRNESVYWNGATFVLNVNSAAKFSSVEDAISFVKNSFSQIRGYCLARNYDFGSLTILREEHIPVFKIDSDAVINGERENIFKEI